MRNCPSLYHGEPGDPYGCYEEMQAEEAAEDRAFAAGVQFCHNKASRLAKEWDRAGGHFTFADFVLALNLKNLDGGS